MSTTEQRAEYERLVCNGHTEDEAAAIVTALSFSDERDQVRVLEVIDESLL